MKFTLITIICCVAVISGQAQHTIINHLSNRTNNMKWRENKF